MKNSFSLLTAWFNGHPDHPLGTCKTEINLQVRGMGIGRVTEGVKKQNKITGRVEGRYFCSQGTADMKIPILKGGAEERNE